MTEFCNSVRRHRIEHKVSRTAVIGRQLTNPYIAGPTDPHNIIYSFSFLQLMNTYQQFIIIYFTAPLFFDEIVLPSSKAII